VNYDDQNYNNNDNDDDNDGDGGAMRELKMFLILYLLLICFYLLLCIHSIFHGPAGDLVIIRCLARVISLNAYKCLPLPHIILLYSTIALLFSLLAWTKSIL
jgi:hypothetical protein